MHKNVKIAEQWLNNLVPERNFGPTVAFAFFFGIFGVHRFYTGYKKIGIIQLCLTLTLFGLIGSAIWALIDTISISLNKFKDSQGRELKNYNKTFGVIICIIAVLVFLCSLKNGIDGANMVETPQQTNQTQQSNQIQQSANKITASENLEVLEHKIAPDEFGGKDIVGTIRNNTNKNYSYAQVDINLYDNNGTLLDSTMANINNLEPHGLWKFKAPIIEDNVASYKIKEVSGY